MKFSVLIPCRNRLDNLKNAVASVLLQDYQDFEVIISDNSSAEDLKGFVASLNDARIRYSRTEKFISVTENWNRTVEQITGDYVVMLGDDDCLMNGYFSTIRKLALEHSFPELVYSDAFLYAYPGVLSNYPKGYLRTTGNCSFWKRSSPFCLDQQEAAQFAKKTMSFKFSFSFNMQYATIHCSLVEKLKFQGSFFHSPYPDYYAMTLLLKKARKILICPYPMTVIGISPKSFGYYYFNNKEAEGMEFLNNKDDCNLYPELTRIVLPGSMMNTCWLYALASLQKNYSFLENSEIDVLQYRRLQIMKYLRTIRFDKNRISLLSHFMKSLHWWEIILYSIEIPSAIPAGHFSRASKIFLS
jgi:glycosyltransferase involved in cell wall biosynthesis